LAPGAVSIDRLLLFFFGGCLHLVVELGIGGEHRFDVLALLALVVVVRDLNDESGQRDEADEVRDRHETVRCVRDLPCERARHDGGYNDECDVDQLEDKHRDLLNLFRCLLKEELDRLFAVEGPGHDRREGEEREDDREYDSSEYSEVAGENAHDGGGIGHIGRDRGCIDVGEEEQRGERADDEGVKEHLENAPESLLYRLFGVRYRVCDDRRAEAGLVREYASCHTFFDDGREYVTGNTAGKCLGSEAILEDKSECGTDVLNVHTDADESHNDEEQTHKRHESRGDLGDTLDAAEDDDGNESGYADTDDQLSRLIVLSDRVCDRCGDLVGLCAGHTDGGNSGKEGGNVCEPSPLESVVDVVEGTALVGAVVRLLSEVNAEYVFRVVGDHSEECGDPHPENRAGAAGNDSRRNTDDVSGSDCSRDRRRKGFKRGNATLFIL